MPGGKKIEKSKQPVEKYESQFSKYKIGPEGEIIFCPGRSAVRRIGVFGALACTSSKKSENAIFSQLGELSLKFVFRLYT